VNLSSDHAIEHLALAVIDRSLPKSEWTHEGHFAAALWLLKHRPALTSPEAMRKLISRYNEATQTPNTDSGGYHHTITCASMRAAADFLAQRPPGEPLHLGMAALMASELGHPDWLLVYWSRARLFSVEARRDWVEPDLANLPF